MAATLERPVEAAAPPRTRATRARSYAVDALRGLAIVVMVVCNNHGIGPALPGTTHAPWNGWSFADLFFPVFLFVVGASMAFSLGERADGGGADLRFHLRLVQRAATLFVLGLVMHGFPFGDLSAIRVTGVLQRIALAFLLAALVVVHLRRRAQYVVAAAVLVVSWAAVALVPVPGLGKAAMTPEHNLPGVVDRMLLGERHVYLDTTFDPEGLFTTPNAVVTVLAGYWVIRWLRGAPLSSRTSRRLALGGLGAMALAHVWDLALPINKKMWTSSFVVLCAGASMVLLALAYEVLEVRGHRWSGAWLTTLGRNAIVLYVGTELTGDYLERWGAKDALHQVLSPVLPGVVASTSYAALILAGWSAVAFAMARRRWFVKV